jgi:hypothetical protein
MTNLTENEKRLLRQVTQWGSGSYPIRLVSPRKWIIDDWLGEKMSILNTHTHVTMYSSESTANEIAAQLQSAEEGGWKYEVVPPPEGSRYYKVEILDEDGQHVAFYSN